MQQHSLKYKVFATCWWDDMSPTD